MLSASQKPLSAYKQTHTRGGRVHTVHTYVHCIWCCGSSSKLTLKPESLLCRCTSSDTKCSPRIPENVCTTSSPSYVCMGILAHCVYLYVCMGILAHCVYLCVRIRTYIQCVLYVYIQEYSETSDSGLSQVRTQYDKPLYKGHNSRSQYNSYNTF